jgi:predicted nucleotidyltransferase component of viral defense system
VEATPIVDVSTESEREPKSLSRVIFDRIGTLERTRLQTKCLQLLSTTPVWNQLVFRGPVAIHGVHLHGRCSRDLDFLAPPEVKERFVEILAEQGIELQKKEDARIPHFPMQGTVFKDIAVGIDVCSREVTDMVWVNAHFQGAGGVTIPVQVLPFPLLMGEKFRATVRRARSSDFYDVWLFAQRFPDLLAEVRRLLISGEVAGEQFEFSTSKVWAHLQEVRDSWHQDLIEFMPQVPSFETVERDLSRTMEFLSAVPTPNYDPGRTKQPR